jgi:hypothetical protein
VWQQEGGLRVFYMVFIQHEGNLLLFPAAVWLAIETMLQQEPTMHSVFEE